MSGQELIPLKRLEADHLLLAPDRLREDGWPNGTLEAADLGTLPASEQGYLRWATAAQVAALQQVLYHRHCYVRYTVFTRPRYDDRRGGVTNCIPDRVVVVFQRPIVLAVLEALRVRQPPRMVKAMDEKDIAVLKWGPTGPPLWLVANREDKAVVDPSIREIVKPFTPQRR